MDEHSELKNRKIIVTGATGWVGKTFLIELQKWITQNEFNNTVWAFASSPKSINSVMYPENQISIPIRALTELDKCDSSDNALVFHSAFLTRNKISQYGLETFKEINESITEEISKYVERCKYARVISISSGAAEESEKRKEISFAKTNNPYGYLKLREEKRLREIAQTQVLRIYALTGRYITNAKSYAIGDLLIQAMKKKRLKVNSPNPVIRSYVSARDIAKYSIRWLMSNEITRNPIGASTHITTIAELAKIIARYYNLEEPEIEIRRNKPNSYCCSPVEFDQQLKRFYIKPMNLIDQIKNTAEGIKEEMNITGC